MGRPLPIGVFAGGLVSRWPNLFSLYLACGPVYIAGRLIGLGATTTATVEVELALNFETLPDVNKRFGFRPPRLPD